jgi:hypothetical protein
MSKPCLTSFALLTALALVTGCGSDSESDGGGKGGTGGGSGGSAGSSTGGSAGTGTGGSSGGGTGGGGPCTLGTSWELVDDYALASPEPTFGVGVVSDSAGNIYVVANGKQGTMKGLVRKSTNGGTSWTDVTWNNGIPNDIAADSQGNVYVITGGTAGRVLYKTTNGGDSWDEIDSFPLGGSGTNDPCNTGYVAVGPNDVIVDGGSCDSTGWVVRKSTTGTDFQQVFTFQLAPGKSSRMEDVGVGSTGDAFATGAGLDANDISHWMVVTEGSATGSVSDDFQLLADQNANPRKLHRGSSMLAVGFASDGNTTQGVLRRLTEASWSTIDTPGTHALDVVEVGNQLVIAGDIEEDTIQRVVTRISTDGGTQFNPLDEYSYVTGKSSRSVALTKDPTGNVYAVIGAQDAQDANRVIVRKLSCQ